MKNSLISVLVFAAFFFSTTAYSGDIVSEWDMTKWPAKPELQSVTVDSKTTALLVLDIEERTCNMERRPRCIDSVPKIANLVKMAREKGISVMYSLTSKGTIETILPPVKPVKGEPVVKSSVNKFYGTKLDDYLKQKGIKTVIITGTAAHGAVLHTATAASVRKYKIIVPVDGLSASTHYIEQATVINLIKGPGTRRSTVLTRSDLISIK